MKVPLLLLLSLLFGTEIACSGQFLNHDTRHGSASFRSLMPVDAAFTRIKSEFGLHTWIDVLTGSRARKKARDPFRYSSQPGHYYNMEGKITHRYGAGFKRHPVRVLVHKQGRGSRVLIDYWITDPSITGLRGYGQSLVKRAQSALK